jgi:hypothetical protein
MSSDSIHRRWRRCPSRWPIGALVSRHKPSQDHTKLKISAMLGWYMHFGRYLYVHPHGIKIEKNIYRKWFFKIDNRISTTTGNRAQGIWS